MTTYKVTGNTPFMGHKPGEEFEAELDPALESRAKARHAIRVVKRDTPTQNQQEKEEGDA